MPALPTFLMLLATAVNPPAGGAPPILRPQASESRSLQSLDGLWRLRIDAEGHGDAQRWWAAALQNTTVAPVPATLNDVGGLDGYFGAVWYERDFFAAPGGESSGQGSLIYFESATANAQVWLNGQRLGAHRGVGLPFGWQVGAEQGLLAGRANRLTVRVDGQRTWQDLPPGASTTSKYGRPMLLGGDAGYYYSTPGIDGSVWLGTVPAVHAVVDVNTRWDGRRLQYNISCGTGGCGDSVQVTLEDEGGSGGGAAVVASSTGAAGALEVVDPNLWWPIGSPHGQPFLYTLHIQTGTNSTSANTVLTHGSVDHHRLRVGLRTIAAVGRQIQINGKPVYLRGADHHIDGHLRGHGVDRVLHAMDLALMRKTNLNAFRVNSWALPETLLDLCDELGFLVQSEVPAIALRAGWDPECSADIFAPSGSCANATTLANHKLAFNALYARDKNRPSVISFSLSNEPEDHGASAGAVAYFSSLVQSARSEMGADDRLLTIEGVSDAKFYQLVPTDIVSVHSYPGWYDYCPLSEVTGEMEAFLAKWSTAFPDKPLIVSEYGAGAIPGHHSVASLQFTEESQVAILKASHVAFERFRQNASLAGEHVHAWSDFQQTGATVAQTGGARGMLLDIDGLNFKGLFSRNREPKAAAALLRSRYAMIAREEQWLASGDLQ